MDREKLTQVELYKVLLRNYHKDLVLLQSCRKPQTHISPEIAVSINIILRDIQNLLEQSMGFRYLSLIDTEKSDISLPSAILTISPYLVILETLSDHTI